MRFAFWYVLPLAAAVAASLGCSLSDAGLAGEQEPPGVPGPNATLAFDEEGTLELAPGELRLVTAVGSPPASYEMSFSLLGEAAGAFLDRSIVVAEPNGRASVTVHAPDIATTFRLRATLKDGPSAEIGVAVSEEGFGTIRALPAYDGEREVTGWTASVTAGTTCDEIAALLPGEPPGALVETSSEDEPVLVESAPVGPNLAVVVRSGKAMWGCADEPDLKAGTTRDVKVIVKDGPIDLGATSLDLELTYGSTGEVAALHDATIDRLVDAFLPEGDEAAALLDAMHLALPADQQPEFASQRAAGAWDDVAAQHLGALPATLADVCRGWAEAGVAAQSPRIVAHLGAIGDVPGQALLEVSELFGVPASEAGVPPAHLVAWTSDPGDVLVLGGALFWMPSRYAGAAAWQAAEADVPGAASMAEALAAVASCDALAPALGGFAGCDEACMAALCKSGLSARWQLALDASAASGLLGGIEVSAFGEADVSSDAAPIGWQADWLGKITDGDVEATVMGEATGVASDEVP